MRRAALVLAALAALALATAGCGEKIAIPQPVGVFGLREYTVYTTYAGADARQVLLADGNLYILTADELILMNLEFEEQARAGGFADATAVCFEPDADHLLVWSQGAKTVSVLTKELEPVAAQELPEIGAVASMVTSDVGREADPEAVTFLYLADPEAAVVHRYTVDAYGGLLPFGILAADLGGSVRDIKRPVGLARDAEGAVLVADTDSLRHWVIRFDPTPDQGDAELRGTPQTYLPFSQCPGSPAASEFILGNAPECQQEDWVAGPLDSLGVFDTPSAVSVAGEGRIYVADTGNDRFQVFTATGEYAGIHFTSPDDIPQPGSIAVYDAADGVSGTFFGARVFVVLPGGLVRAYDSYDYSNSNPGQRPNS